MAWTGFFVEGRDLLLSGVSEAGEFLLEDGALILFFLVFRPVLVSTLSLVVFKHALNELHSRLLNLKINRHSLLRRQHI